LADSIVRHSRAAGPRISARSKAAQEPNKKDFAMTDPVIAWETWRGRRLAAALDRFGPASLVNTAWPGAGPAAVDRVGGKWLLADGAVVGQGLPLSQVTALAGGARRDGPDLVLPPGATAEWGDLRLLALDRFGQLGLRVFDSKDPRHLALRGIETWPYDPAWVVTAEFAEPAEPRQVEVEHVDATVVQAPLAATFRFSLPGSDHELSAAGPGRHGYNLSFQDQAALAEGAGFRFLHVEPPAAGRNQAVLDFNQATLPPCGFSAHYLCPLPLPGNRLNVGVPAGERRLTWHDHEGDRP
jgi:uncharacterized protein (DUF1684 family)